MAAPQDPMGGLVHELPTDLKEALYLDEKALSLWQQITPLARNEWICWTITVKQQKTRDEHVTRVISQLKGGKRRPCCWLGCIHRTDKPISPSVQSIIEKRTKKNNPAPTPPSISEAGAGLSFER